MRLPGESVRSGENSDGRETEWPGSQRNTARPTRQRSQHERSTRTPAAEPARRTRTRSTERRAARAIGAGTTARSPSHGEETVAGALRRNATAAASQL